MENKPQWVIDYNLEASGLYYEGFVDDFESVLSKHRMSTMTTYGTRKSRKCADRGCSEENCDGENKENDEGVSSGVIQYVSCGRQ